MSECRARYPDKGVIRLHRSGDGVRHWAGSTWLVVLLAFAVSGFAQAQSQPVPPDHYTPDLHGVDLISGQFSYSATEVVISARRRSRASQG
jgi:hypothetical protein